MELLVQLTGLYQRSSNELFKLTKSNFPSFMNENCNEMLVIEFY